MYDCLTMDISNQGTDILWRIYERLSSANPADMNVLYRTVILANLNTKLDYNLYTSAAPQNSSDRT